MSLPLFGAGPSAPGVAGGPIDPATVSGLTLWLDASDASTLWQDSTKMSASSANGDPVGYWGDKSGNNNHVVQNDPTLKPSLRTNIQNGKNVVRGDGVNDILTSSTGGADSSFTLFVVTISRLDGTQFAPFSVGEQVLQKCRILQKPTNNTIQFSASSGFYSALYAPVVNSSLTWPANTGIIAQVKSSSGFVSLAKNNGAFSTPVEPVAYYGGKMLAYTSTVIRVMNGNNSAYNGDICELLYYTAALSDANKAGIVAYLNAKWSVY